MLVKNFLRLFLLFSGFVTTLAYAKTTKEVWEHHIQAWEMRSIPKIVSDYAENGILVLNNKTYKGHAQIAKVFTRLFEIFDGGSNRIDTPVIVDRIVYITWHFSPNGQKEFFGTDTFLIERDKIVFQTIASPLYDSYPVDF